MSGDNLTNMQRMHIYQMQQRIQFNNLIKRPQGKYPVEKPKGGVLKELKKDIFERKEKK